MKQGIAVLFAALALGTITAGEVWASEVVDIYKSPYCGCCGKWADHLRSAGFEVRTHEVTDVPAARKNLGMPDRFGSCHTAKVAGYVIEGHVPAADIRRLLTEKPRALGLAVPSMPPGSPGMESPQPVSYDTLLVKPDGNASVFAKH
ncbi:MAG: DUF411 domain-containing protein [Rhodocyclaceae bacterium]|nr:DUF411 domain-containing protein [Rhodocyclaceae bacterium]MBX3670952.1 DUF411 domain-containing protein [Rhodocyclaceae bacterium]